MNNEPQIWANYIELCDHTDGRIVRTAHGYLGDAPRGTVQILCAGCGDEVPGPRPSPPRSSR